VGDARGEHLLHWVMPHHPLDAGAGPGGAEQERGRVTDNKVHAGKGRGRESQLHVKLDRHLFSKQLLLMFLDNGLSSSEVRVWQGEAGLFFSDR